jgi:hypothetical protein
MAGLVLSIHVLSGAMPKTWMPAQASLRSLRKLGCERGHDRAANRKHISHTPT